MGLKENVIIGRLIPAGTGLARYRAVEVETPFGRIREPMTAREAYDAGELLAVGGEAEDDLALPEVYDELESEDAGIESDI